jgi:hypothetical protein
MKALAKILLLLVGIQCIGMALVHNGMVYFNRWQQFANIENNKNLEYITISKSEYKKACFGSNEIELNGNRYDVVAIKSKGNIIELKVINDKKEVKLLGLIKSNINNSNNANNNDTKKINYFLSKYVLATSCYKFLYNSSPTIFFYNNVVLQAAFMPVVICPPEALFASPLA